MPKPQGGEYARIRHHLDQALGEAKAWDEVKAEDRKKAYRYYRARKLGNPRPGQPRVVSSDVLDAVEAMLPDLLEIFAGSEEPVAIKPRTTRATDSARLNKHLLKYQRERQLNWFEFLYTWLKDGLLYRNGICRWGWKYEERVHEERYETIFLPELRQKLNQGAELVSYDRDIPSPLGGQALGLANAVIREIEVVTDQPEIEVIPPGNFLISRSAKTIKESPFVALRDFPTRYELSQAKEQLGYFDLNAIPKESVSSTEEEQASFQEIGREDPQAGDDEGPGQWARVERFTCYVLWPGDDGEMVPMVATLANERLIGWQENVFKEPPFLSWSPILDTHKFEGISLVDLTMEYQHIKTTLWRALLSFMAHQTSPQHLYERDAGVDLNALLAGRPHSLVGVDPGKLGAVRALERPQLGSDVWRFIEFLESGKEQRLGVTRLNQGLMGGSLNDTARGMMSLMQKADKRLRLIARLFAEMGLKPLFRRLIKMNQEFIDQEMVLGVSENEDVNLSPEMLGGDLDLVVNVGLGNSDSAMTIQQMQQLLGILLQVGQTPQGQGLITPQNIYHVVRHIVEAMGRPGTQFVTDPDEQGGMYGFAPNGQGAYGAAGTGMPGQVGPGPAGPGAVGAPGMGPGGGALAHEIPPELMARLQAAQGQGSGGIFN
jgi:hypothetical protein